MEQIIAKNEVDVVTCSPAVGVTHPSTLGIIESFPEEVMFKVRPKREVRVGQAAPDREQCVCESSKVRQKWCFRIRGKPGKAGEQSWEGKSQEMGLHPEGL